MVKFLILFDDKSSENVLNIMRKIREKLTGDVCIVYVKSVEHYYPAEILIEMDKSYDSLKEKGKETLNRIVETLKEMGFHIFSEDIYIGQSPEIRHYLETCDPDFLIDFRTS